MINHVITILTMLATASAAVAGTVDFSYVPPDAVTETWGTARAETFSVAVKVPGANLSGGKVTAISVPVPEGVAMTGCSVFVSKELKGSRGVVKADLSYDFEPAQGTVTVTLPDAYSVTGDFYAGYSFRIAKAEGADAEPIVVGGEYRDGGFFITSSRTYAKWQSPASSGVSLALGVRIEGDFKAADCAVTSLENVVTTPATALQGKAVIVNCGLDPVSSLNYTYEVDGKKSEGAVTFTPAVAADFISTGEFSYDVPAIAGKGSYGGTLTIVKVNGEDCDVAPAANKVEVMDVIPLRRVVMEEFTGTWCGFCPRGMVAMELLGKEYPDRFIALAYHSGDIMETQPETPVPVDGYPMATLDRVVSVDPYFGTSQNRQMYIREDVKSRLALPVTANVDVEAAFSEDLKKIQVNAYAYYFKDLTDNPYLMSFAVTEDGLGTDSIDPLVQVDWMQKNYYVGEDGWDSCMDPWTEGKALVLTRYDHVLIGTAPYKGVYGSQPASVAAGQTAACSYEFDCSEFVSTCKDKEGVSLLQNYDKVSVVALLVNKNTGVIENAAKVRLAAPAGVERVESGASRTETGSELYDLSGRRLSAEPASGLFIEITKYSDGTVRASKRVR